MIFSDEKVKIIKHDFTDPAFNLACEEYFLKKSRDAMIILWRNSPAIIIGKNQNALAEIDLDYVEKNDIKVIRRLTGGGAVYHDLGNLNYTFIANNDSGFADFKTFLDPVTKFLCSLGLNAGFSGRNDILIDSMKVSGTAQASINGRVMIHGTLLFSVHLDVLANALKPNPLKLKSKGISSVKSRVTNISSHLKSSMDIQDFTQELYTFLLENTPDCTGSELTNEDIENIEKIKADKYDTWHWNIGSAPNFSMQNEKKLESGIVSVMFDIKSGKIERVKFYGDFFGERDISELEGKLIGVAHNHGALSKFFKENECEKYIAFSTPNTLTPLFFKKEETNGS